MAGSAGKGTGLVIVAAGSSTRMGGIDKIRSVLSGFSIICHSVRTLGTLATRTVVVAGPLGLPSDAMAALDECCSSWEVIDRAGTDRQGSVRLGLAALGYVEYVAVHDGARPLAPARLLSDGLALLDRFDGAVPGLPAVDTLKEVDEAGRITRTLPRDAIYSVQTPQVFRADALREAHLRAEREGVPATDDASLLERTGRSVSVFLGDRRNIKITGPEDITIASCLLGQEPQRR